jgi:hypothetical protein
MVDVNSTIGSVSTFAAMMAGIRVFRRNKRTIARINLRFICY